ncbi:hypothetical protein [Streptomyces spectabilis]|uniref:Uncharacterized protein n=1 Tax=Streptomyces spectabilis TaxID=68270 RepID=A0A516RHN9_STRST|nr:hypothetical protein [Streptomyces spectabilis]QDQ15172.1 hypothetical protein FH965_35280 [Streptomyces spectabilis]
MAGTRLKFSSTAAAAALAAVALTGLGAGTANAAEWPPLREGAYLYSGTHGTGKEFRVDLDDVGTCHTLSTPPRSLQIVSGSGSLVLYPGADCTGASSWASGSLAQSDLPWAARSYRVVPA